MLKTTQEKYCIYLYAFKPVYLLNNGYKNNKKGQYLHWLVKISKWKSAQVKVLCLLVYILNLMYLLNEKKDKNENAKKNENKMRMRVRVRMKMRMKMRVEMRMRMRMRV